MPHHFRNSNGLVRKARQRIPFLLPDGTEGEDIGDGPAQNEKPDRWQGKSGFELVQTEEADAVAVRDDDANEIRGDKTTGGARQFFVMEPETVGKGGPYRLARMVTTEAAPQQTAYFRDARFALLGIMNPDGSISVIEPLAPPPAEPSAQGELF